MQNIPANMTDEKAKYESMAMPPSAVRSEAVGRLIRLRQLRRRHRIRRRRGPVSGDGNSLGRDLEIAGEIYRAHCAKDGAKQEVLHRFTPVSPPW